MRVFKKRITLTFRVWVLVFLLLLIVSMVLCSIFRIPDNLFFMALRPQWIETALVYNGGEPFELTREQVCDLVEILNDVRITGRGQRLHTPGAQESFPLQLKLTCGKWLYLNASISNKISINANSYEDRGQMRDKLFEFLWQVRKEAA